ncbi:MAG: zf-HC2 domain-containing protein [Acidobacteria bacterium]|nr:zf-HC2 domain-containing protein [Acidobacteriota bacterium]
MRCEECKELIPAFMDSDLPEEVAAPIREHLGECDDCAAVCEDLTTILDACKIEPSNNILTPNSEKMWLRINNVLEHEVKPLASMPPPPKRRFWHVSLAQLVTAVLAIAALSSVVTIIAFQYYRQMGTDEFSARLTTQSSFEKFLGRFGLIDTPQQARERRIKEQQATIDYWNARVQTRRLQWDSRTREAFDRNLRVIDDSLNEYSTILQQDPEDELSSEMFDAVLSDKMNLLRDFSDL